MMHNIGEALLYMAHGEKVAKINELVKARTNRVELQRNQFGYDYAAVGAELANRWNFPELIVTAIKEHAALMLQALSPLAGIVF